MKLKLVIPSTVLALAAIFGVVSAHAENDTLERANIPFDFYAGTQKMPAGTYYFALDIQSDTITISNSAGRNQRMLSGIPDGYSGSQSALVFDHVSGSYFLRDFKSDVLDMSFPVSKAESATGNHVAAAKSLVSVNHT